MILLIAIGMSFQLFNHFDFQNLRYPGVLQRIGVVYFISTFLFLKFSTRALDYTIAIALIGYYLIMTLVPVPDGHPANLDPSTNIAAYIDRLVFSVKHLYKPAKTWDPVGLLSTIPAIATTLFGVKAGLWLRKVDLEPVNKANGLFAAGIILVLGGLVADLFFPINKPLWSSSYVLYSAGICTLGLTITYWFVDIKKRGKNLWPFFVFGTNAITAYILSEIMPRMINLIRIHIGNDTTTGRKFLDNRFLLYLSPNNASVLSAICFVFFIWLIMYPLYRKHIMIKL
jgi:predicted acyltransferase